MDTDFPLCKHCQFRRFKQCTFRTEGIGLFKKRVSSILEGKVLPRENGVPFSTYKKVAGTNGRVSCRNPYRRFGGQISRLPIWTFRRRRTRLWEIEESVSALTERECLRRSFVRSTEQAHMEIWQLCIP